MIIAPTFVWTHMAKTGGSVVHRIIEQIGDDQIQLDPMTDEWADYRRHEPFWLRSQKEGFDVAAGKIKILTIRRLPSWMLSISEFKQATENFSYSKKDLIEGIFKHEKRNMESGNLSDPGQYDTHHADEALNYYRPEEIDIWWKQESLATDVLATIEGYYEISDQLRAEAHAFKENVNSYDRRISANFTSGDLAELYHHCPLWTALEKKVYGDLLV